MSAFAERLNANVYTLFSMIFANVSCITPREWSRSAFGHTLVTSETPSASISASVGQITRVLPAPMIICCTPDLPPFAIFMKSRMSSHCLFRSMKPHMNSMTRKRGSKAVAPAAGAWPPSAPKYPRREASSVASDCAECCSTCTMAESDVPDAFVAASSKMLRCASGCVSRLPP